ncbi:c-type cytochrome [Sneathiella glossodoripedis]|uniref:c-type cytochrome n=1 Tax=Sneathiella glossodoripedis TaxID=418853 RepID=UPI0004704FB3|nr:cytochrome c [Sneathiella glossodoripedis]
MKNSFKTVLSAVLVTGVMGVTVVTAHSTSTGNAEADKRIQMMKELGANMKAIAAVAKGEAAYSAALNENAKRIHEIAVMMPDLFPAGSDTDVDRAKPEIWTKAGEFTAVSKDFEQASAALKAAVETGDQGKIGAALGATGKTCGGCHKPFREPKD